MKANLKAKVKDINDMIDLLFGDMSVMQEDTREALEEIEANIAAKLETLDDGDEDDEDDSDD